MQIREVTVTQVAEAIAFRTLDELENAVWTLGAEEESSSVQELVGELRATVVLGTTRAWEIGAALLSRDHYGSYSPPEGVVIRNPDGVVRQTFIWNEFRRNAPFSRFTIRAWRAGEVYLLSILERERSSGDPREQEQVLAEAMGAARAIRSIEVSCTTQPTPDAAGFELDLEPIMHALANQRLTRMMGEAAAQQLYDRAKRACNNGALFSTPGLHFKTAAHEVQLGLSGCDAAVKDPATWRERFVWELCGSVITGPRTSSPLDEGVLRVPSFWLGVRPLDGPCASESDRRKIVELATALADELRPKASVERSGRCRKRRGG